MDIKDCTNKILCGDTIDVMQTLPDNSVNCCVTSPPYFSQRDYQTATWLGGDASCNHVRDNKITDKNTTGHKAMSSVGVGDGIYKNVCKKCGAIREDKQIGLEGSPEEYVAKLVRVFAEVYRVLRDDGTLFLNLGDTYCGSGRGDSSSKIQKSNKGTDGMPKGLLPAGMKKKDLMGIPWMVAFALRGFGWYLRQDIIWCKNNPLPESVKDRCTKSHEYIFLLSKSPKYYYDADAINEPVKQVSFDRAKRGVSKNHKNLHIPGQSQHSMHKARAYGAGYNMPEKRNKRDVWTVPVCGYKEAHLATYPPKLIEPCILAGCPEGGVVIDPFFGAGTTGVVCLNHKRKYVGIELNPEYCKIAERRLVLAQAEVSLY